MTGKGRNKQLSKDSRSNKKKSNYNDTRGQRKINNNNSNNNNSYKQYFDVEELKYGIEISRYYTGILKVIATRRKVAYVTIEGLTSFDVCVPDEILRNRTAHGDEVIIELLPEDEWVDFAKSVGDKDDISNDSKKGLSILSQNEIEDNKDMQKLLWLPRSFTSTSYVDTKNEKSNNTTPKVPHKIEEIAKKVGKQPCGRVVGVLKSINSQARSRQMKDHIGNLVPLCQTHANESLPQSETYVYFNPSDVRYPNMIVPRIELPDAFVSNPHQARNMIYLADMQEEWPISSKMPKARNVRALGQMGEIETETKALLTQYECNHKPFSEDCINPLKQFLQYTNISDSTEDNPRSYQNDSDTTTWKIPDDEILRRRDFRFDTCICTIDPPTAKDLDDALHVKPIAEVDGPGDYEIGVHIADVTYFLEENSALDLEAQKRATSVYLVQKVIPMLPPILCEQLCSLNPNVDRLAFSCVWRMNADGSIADYPPWFGRSVIRSCAKLDYPTAQRMLDGQIPFEPSNGTDEDAFLSDMPESIWEKARRPIGQAAWSLCRDVRALGAIAKKRRAKRLASGALAMNTVKLMFKRDDEGNPLEVSSYTVRDSNRLVEEYMLLANYLTAQELISKLGPSAFIRNHPSPHKPVSDIKELEKKIGCPVDVSSAAALSKSLRNINRTCDATTYNVISQVLMNMMNLANYLPAGQCEEPEWRHYALSIPYYTHFTSPIRRYADCIVHRLLDMTISNPNVASEHKAGQQQEYQVYLEKIAENCNNMKKNSKAAQERSDRVFLSLFLKANPQRTQALVIGLGEKSFSIFVPEFGFQERLYEKEMTNITFEYFCTKSDSEDVKATSDEDVKLILTKNVDANIAKGKKNDTFFHLSDATGGTMELRLMSKVSVYLTAKMDKPPINVRLTLLGLIE